MSVTLWLEMSDQIVNREDFNRRVKEIFNSKKGCRTHWNKEQFHKIVEILIEAKNTVKKS